MIATNKFVNTEREDFALEEKHAKERETKKCDRCDKNESRRYYCEFCAKEFCGYCTNEKAHKSDISRKYINGCNDVHRSITNDKNDVDNILDTQEMSNYGLDQHDYEHCVCLKNTMPIWTTKTRKSVKINALIVYS